MINSKSIFTLITLLIISLISNAQVKIRGKITNNEDQSPVPFATIKTDKERQTISNENGEFELEVEALPTKLKVSHTSYQAIVIDKSDDSFIDINLKPVTITLSEVTVGNYALFLMKKAFEKAKPNLEEPNYAKAFLRQIAFENDIPTYLNEIYFNADWRSYGLVKWNPTKARQLKNKLMISYTNFSFMSLALSGYIFNNINTKPLNGKLDSLYQFKLKATYALGNDEIAVITCTPKVKINKMYFEGDYLINTATFNVLKIEGIIHNMKISISGPFNMKNYGIELMAQYKTNSNGKTVLDFSTFNLKNKLSVLGIKTKESSFSSTLYMIDYKDIYNKNLLDLDAKTNDNITVKEIANDTIFWTENQTIKRTDRESAAIKILEAVKQVKK